MYKVAFRFILPAEYTSSSNAREKGTEGKLEYIRGKLREHYTESEIESVPLEKPIYEADLLNDNFLLKVYFVFRNKKHYHLMKLKYPRFFEHQVKI